MTVSWDFLTCFYLLVSCVKMYTDAIDTSSRQRHQIEVG